MPDSAVLDTPRAPAAPPAPDPVQVLVELARTNFAAFVTAVHRPRYKHSHFSITVCRAVDKFVDDLIAGKRPVLMLTAPPQHGKSSLISKCMPAYLFGRLAEHLPVTYIAGATYAISLARTHGTTISTWMSDPMYREIFPKTTLIGFKGMDTSTEFEVPSNERGIPSKFKFVGVGGGLTGEPVHVLFVDDSVKNAQEALSKTVQESRVNWYDSVALTRLQQTSGVVLIGTPWSSRDLLAHAKQLYTSAEQFTCLSFPALNLPDEIGYDPDLPLGALVPHLHSEEKLRETKRYISEFWWSAMYQQRPMSEFGSIFKRDHVQYYRRAETPTQFVQMGMSVDAAFKDGESSDYVCAGVWGKTADEKVWLLSWRREKMAFMATAQAIADLRRKHPDLRRIWIEDAANGPALISMLTKHFPGIVGIPPLGSKEARAHAVSWAWEGNLVMLPHPDEQPGIAPLVQEITTFPDTSTGHDDAVDMMTIALQQLMLRTPIAALITDEVLRMAR